MLPIQWLIVLHYLQIIAAQEEMLRKERELEEARKKLAHIRQQQYKFLPSELREDQSWTHLVWLDTTSVGSWLLRMIGCSLYAELEMLHVIVWNTGDLLKLNVIGSDGTSATDWLYVGVWMDFLLHRANILCSCFFKV